MKWYCIAFNGEDNKDSDDDEVDDDDDYDDDKDDEDDNDAWRKHLMTHIPA